MRCLDSNLLPFFAALTLLGGCQTAQRPAPPAPDLELLQAAPLHIPENCVASGSFVVAFEVATTGHPTNIELDAPSCAQQALIAWVESFRYAPPARTTPTSVEWMMVTAKRGS